MIDSHFVYLTKGWNAAYLYIILYYWVHLCSILIYYNCTLHTHVGDEILLFFVLHTKVMCSLTTELVLISMCSILILNVLNYFSLLQKLIAVYINVVFIFCKTFCVILIKSNTVMNTLSNCNETTDLIRLYTFTLVQTRKTSWKNQFKHSKKIFK